MSQFLLDEFDDGNNKDEKKSESIDDKIKIEKVIVKNIVNTNIKTAGQSEYGTAEGGNVNNSASGGDNGTKTIGAGTAGGEDKVGVLESGSKTINRPAILKQRIYQSKDRADTYKVAVMVGDDSENVFISVNALGDDGTQEAVNIVEYKMAGVKYIADKGKIGPISLRANKMEHFDIKLELNKKMLLRLVVY